MTLPDKSPNNQTPRTDQLKAIVMVGSMGMSDPLSSRQFSSSSSIDTASWHGFGDLPMYTATKHAILGLMRGLELRCKNAGIRIGTIHPWLVRELPTYALEVFPSCSQIVPETNLNKCRYACGVCWSSAGTYQACRRDDPACCYRS